MDEAISRQVLDLWNRYRPTIAVDAIEYDRELKKLLGTNLAEVGTDLATKRHVNGFPIDADLLMLKVEEEYGFRARDRLYEIIRYMPKYEQPLIYSKLERLTEPHWISVTERLPEINEDILLSYFDEVTIGWLNSDGSWSIFDGQECVSADEISAWMPLPRAMEFKE